MYKGATKFKMDKTYKKMDNITNSPTPFQSELQAFKHSFLTNLSNYIMNIESIVDPENKRKRGCIINKIDRPWCCVTYEFKFSR